MKRKKHIVFIVENLSVPFDRRVWREANVMYDAGYRISVICPKGLNQDKRSKEIIDGIYIYRYSIPLMQDSKWGYIKEYLKAFFCTFYLLLKINFRHKVHVIHVANPLDIFFPLGWIKKLLRIKFIFDQHDLCPESYLVKYSISKSSMIYKILLWFERQTYNVSDVVVSTNQSIKDIAVERGNIKPDNIFIVRNGPDSDFKKVPVNISVKNNFKYMAAYIGVMGAPDGVENIIYSADYLINTKSYKDIFYILIGYGDEYENIKAIAAPVIEKAKIIAAKKQLPPISGEININNTVISANFSDITEDGVYILHYGKLNSARLISAWVRHLLLNLTLPDGYPKNTIVIGRDPAGKPGYRASPSSAPGHKDECAQSQQAENGDDRDDGTCTDDIQTVNGKHNL